MSHIFVEFKPYELNRYTQVVAATAKSFEIFLAIFILYSEQLVCPFVLDAYLV